MKMMKDILGNLSLENSWVQLKKWSSTNKEGWQNTSLDHTLICVHCNCPNSSQNFFELLALLKFVERSTYSSIFMNYEWLDIDLDHELYDKFTRSATSHFFLPLRHKHFFLDGLKLCTKILCIANLMIVSDSYYIKVLKCQIICFILLITSQSSEGEHIVLKKVQISDPLRHTSFFPIF